MPSITPRSFRRSLRKIPVLPPRFTVMWKMLPDGNADRTVRDMTGDVIEGKRARRVTRLIDVSPRIRMGQPNERTVRVEAGVPGNSRGPASMAAEGARARHARLEAEAMVRRAAQGQQGS